MKLYKKVNLIFIATQVCVLLMAGFFIYTNSANAIRSEIRSKMVKLKENTFLSFKNKIHRMGSDAEIITDMIKNSYEPEEILKQAHKRFSDYTNIIVTDKNGHIIDMSPYDENYYGKDISHEQYWQQAKISQEQYLSGFDNTFLGYRGIAIAKPISFEYGLGEAGFTGVLVAFINDRSLFAELMTPTIDDYGITVVTDSLGALISNTNGLQTRDFPLSQNELFILLSKKRSAGLNEITFYGTKYLYSVNLFQDVGLDWKLISIVPEQVAFSQIEAIRNKVLIILILGVGLASCVVYFVLRYCFAPLSILVDKCTQVGKGNFDVNIKTFSKDEIGSLSETFNEMTRNLKNAQENEKKQLMNIARSQIALEIAHDIRAPLTVLEQITSGQNSEYDKKMVLQATKRIQSISENLLNFNKTKNFTSTIGAKHIFLSHVVKKMIDEKGLQAKSSERFIFLTTELQSMFLGAQIHLSDVERILSNLIDNSLEALSNKDHKEIKIILAKSNNNAKIQITDNGNGIPTEVLSKLCQKGATFGKKNGNGLGLYHAKKTVEEWDGEFKIESQVGVGTTVSFTVPVVEAPNYFALQLVVQSDSHIVILDDDQSIIDSWRNRLSKMASFHGRVTAFTTIADFENWLGQQGSNKNFIFLCDFDFGDSQIFGLDVIAKHSLQAQSVLVTGRADDVEIQKRVEELGTKLLPKDWIEDIEIQVLSNTSKTNDQTAVLIDDDELIRGLWQNKAKAKNISLVCYESSHAFTTNISKHPCHTAIYVDSDLKGERGEEFVKYLATNGFLNVTLTTGYPESKFQDMPWITKVIDKSPPW